MPRQFVLLPEFRERIKNRRKELGFSLNDVGVRIGIDRNTIKLMEDGKINDPGLSKALKILAAIGLDASALMDTPDTDSRLEQIILLIQEEKTLTKKQKYLLVNYLDRQQERARLKIKTIIIVDDQEVFLSGARVLLENNGYEVITATNYESAIQKINDSLPQLVLLDLDLKEDHNGLDILEYIQEKHSNIPCVILSGLRNQQMAQEGLRKGAFDYLDKEEDMEKIFFIIERINETQDLRESAAIREALNL